MHSNGAFHWRTQATHLPTRLKSTRHFWPFSFALPLGVLSALLRCLKTNQTNNIPIRFMLIRIALFEAEHTILMTWHMYGGETVSFCAISGDGAIWQTNKKAKLEQCFDNKSIKVNGKILWIIVGSSPRRNFEICICLPCGTLIDFNELNWLRWCWWALSFCYRDDSFEQFTRKDLEREESHSFSVEFLVYHERWRMTWSDSSAILRHSSRFCCFRVVKETRKEFPPHACSYNYENLFSREMKFFWFCLRFFSPLRNEKLKESVER